MNVHGEIKGDKLVLTIDVSEKTLANPVISKTEQAKATKDGRTAEATQIATSGGFLTFGKVKVSLNAMLA